MRFRFVFMLLLMAFFTHAQEGLWEVTKVEAGDEIVTPVAKWFDLSPRQTVVSGNGGITNLYGFWNYDAQKGTLLFKDQDANEDPYGSFQVEKTLNTMQLSRVEDGVKVVVSLKRTDEKPKAPWDLIVGNWKLESMEEPTDAGIFIRWDRQFRNRGLPLNGKPNRGFWHIDAHHPVLTFTPNHSGGQVQTFNLVFTDKDHMEWKPTDSSIQHILWTFERISQ